MKKKIIFCILCFSLLNVCGCRNKNISDEIYDNCKDAVEITDDFLNKYISADKAYSMLNKIDCDSSEGNTDENLVCIHILGLQLDFSSYTSSILSNTVTTTDIQEARDELANECGL